MHMPSLLLYITVPDPVSILVESVGTQRKPIFLPSGNIINVTLSCTVQIDPAVDIPVTVQTNWNGPDGFSFNNIATNIVNNTHFTSMATVGSLELKKAGVYHCMATVMASPENQFIMNTGTNENETTLALCKFRQNLTISAVFIVLFLVSISAGKEQATYTVGDAITIQCKVNSQGTAEEPMIFWSRERDSQRITNSTNLHFDQLMASNAVTYYCHASFGSAMGKERLTVTANCKCDTVVEYCMIVYNNFAFYSGHGAYSAPKHE